MPRQLDHHVFEEICREDALRQAARTVALKRRQTLKTSAFFSNFEHELAKLGRELREERYHPACALDVLYRVADPLRDEIVRQALCPALQWIVMARSVPQAFANGADDAPFRAVRAYEQARDRHGDVLRGAVLDLPAALDHAILKDELRQQLDCLRTLRLLDVIIDDLNDVSAKDFYFPGDDLFTPFSRQRGIPRHEPIGKLFADIYLDRLDRWATIDLKAVYLRYQHRFALFHDDRVTLWQWRDEIERRLESLRLKVDQEQTTITRSARRVEFLNFKLSPTTRRRVMPKTLSAPGRHKAAWRDEWVFAHLWLEDKMTPLKDWLSAHPLPRNLSFMRWPLSSLTKAPTPSSSL